MLCLRFIQIFFHIFLLAISTALHQHHHGARPQRIRCARIIGVSGTHAALAGGVHPRSSVSSSPWPDKNMPRLWTEELRHSSSVISLPTGLSHKTSFTSAPLIGRPWKK